MSDRTHIEVLSNRLKVRNVVEPGGEPLSSAQLARSGFSGRPIADRYSPTNRIGRGRLGEIYEAEDAAGRDVGVERRVALQRIDDRIVAESRFVDELETGFALLRAGSHPNVVKIIDFFRDGKAYYLVMELLDGVALRSVLDEAAPEALSLEETASVVRAVGDGLQYLHAKSMVHGDVRPANVFITFDYGVKLLDVTPLTPRSPAPYRVEDAEHGPRIRDVRDDVYDLACLTYELLSGRHPFNACSPLDAHRAGLTIAPLPHLTMRQWDAIARGLTLQRAQRTPSVAQFLSEFGISGTERLRAPTDRPVAPRSDAHVVPLHAVPLHSVPQPSFTPPPAPRHVEAPARAPEPVHMPMHAVYFERELPRPQGSESNLLRGLVLFVVLVALGALALWDFDALRNGAARLTAGRGSEAAPGLETPAALPPVAPAASPPSSPAAQTAREAAPDASAAASDQAAPAPVAAAPAAETTGAASAAAAVSTPQPAQTPLPTEIVEPNVVATVRDTPRSVPAERAEPAGSSVASPGFRFAQPVMTVSEGQTAAAIVIERSIASSPATVVWWTSGDTAIADEDYANLGQRTERFAAGEQSRTIYVPLVADTLPERSESFFVYLGQRDAGRGRLQQLANLRVNIRDND